MPFGVAELDKMLWGGLPSGSTTALLGAPGAGKTMLGLSFLVEGARQGQQRDLFRLLRAAAAGSWRRPARSASTLRAVRRARA